MAKKKRVQLEAWCWYCDREFEDDKVLLQHQKAKHYKCPQCPRRLNTAGGLTVHLHQVHKSEPGRIENALPGRDSFDIEIYGMVGIPEADLAEWRARKAANGGGGGGGQQPSQKRQKIENVALTPQQLKAQLEAHKALMNGQAPPPGATVAPTYATPPPQAAPYSGPPPPGPWMAPGSAAGPSAYSGPPPTLAPQQPSPHQIAVRNGAKNRIVYSDTLLSPEEKLASTSKYLYFDPDEPRPHPSMGYDQHHQQPYAYPPPPAYNNMQQPPPQPHLQPPPPPTGYYSGPPPAWPPVAAYSSSASPYAAGSPAQGATNNSPFPVPSPMSPAGGAPGASSSPAASYSNGAQMYNSATAAAVSPPSYPNTTPAQSYPAYPPGASPPAARPWDNTAEALAAANQSVTAPGTREVETAYMESKAQQETSTSAEDTTTDPSSSQSESNPVVKPTAAGGRRAKAADLF